MKQADEFQKEIQLFPTKYGFRKEFQVKIGD